jgi:hypothetical protein
VEVAIHFNPSHRSNTQKVGRTFDKTAKIPGLLGCAVLAQMRLSAVP